MTPERWHQIDKLLEEALERDPSERAAFLDQACAGDEALRRKVEELLAAHERAESFIETAVMEHAAQTIAAQARSMIGRQLGRYEIISLLGVGGMGVVYRARDTKLDRTVALKLLPARVAADAERLRRFLREAKAASALNHPNIATIYEIGEDDDGQFIAMEYVEGQTLAARISGQPLKTAEIVEIAIQIADALAEAHARGITHRDIKPGNVMLTSRSQVKVLDFGLAKVAKPEANTGTGETSTMAATTQPGVVLGTVPYMSPEQVLGHDVDHRSDIFSLGVSLYELMTGRLPFAGATTTETMDRILHAQPESIARFNYDLPAELERIVRKCLEKDREWRYQSARDLLIDLQHLKRESGLGIEQAAKKAGESVRQIAPQRTRTSRFALATIITALAVGISAVVWMAVARRGSKNPIPAPKTIPLTSSQGAELFPSFNPDGTQFAFTWDGEKGGNFDVYTRSVEHGVPVRLTSDPAEEQSPAWSPDGRWIAFLRFLPDGSAGLFLTTPLSRAERQLAEVAAPGRRVGFWGPHLAWSPDSKWIVTADKSSPETPWGLVLISIANGDKRTITSSPKWAQKDIAPSFSPDGHSVAFIRIFGFYVSELYLLGLTNDLRPKGEPVRLTYFEDQRTTSPVWSKDGREIFFASGVWLIKRLYRIAPSEPGKPQQIESVGEVGPVLAISHASDRLAYLREIFDTNIWRLGIGTNGSIAGAPASFTSSTRMESLPQFSPDGKRVAFLSNRSGYDEVWVCDSDGSNGFPLTSFRGPETGCPRWSPDGERIVFQSLPKGNLDIYLINVRGGTPERLTHESGEDNLPSWSRSGQWIYFHSSRSGGSQVWKMRTDGSGAVQVTRNGGFAAMESTDGKYLYYSKHTGRGSGVWRVPVDGGEEIEVLAGISDWSNYAVADQGIYFTPRRDPTVGSSIQFLSFADGQIKTIATLAKPVFLGLTTSPDGRSLLYSQVDHEGFDLMLIENFR